MARVCKFGRSGMHDCSAIGWSLQLTGRWRVIGATVITDEIEMPLDKADKSVLGTAAEAVFTKEPTAKAAEYGFNIGRGTNAVCDCSRLMGDHRVQLAICPLRKAKALGAFKRTWIADVLVKVAAALRCSMPDEWPVNSDPSCSHGANLAPGQSYKFGEKIDGLVAGRMEEIGQQGGRVNEAGKCSGGRTAALPQPEISHMSRRHGIVDKQRTLGC